MDGHQHVEYDLRRNSPRIVAHSFQHAHSPPRGSHLNPAAKSGDADWRVLYISAGDGGSGEANTSIRSNPQRLDNLAGKILRIIPDLNEHVGASTVSENGRYRIPNDNPF